MTCTVPTCYRPMTCATGSMACAVHSWLYKRTVNTLLNYNMAHVADTNTQTHFNTRTSRHDLYCTSKLPAVDERHWFDDVRSVHVAIHASDKERAVVENVTCHGPSVPTHTATSGLRVMTQCSDILFDFRTRGMGSMECMQHSERAHRE